MSLFTLQKKLYPESIVPVPYFGDFLKKVYEGDTTDFDKKSQHNFSQIKIEDCSFKAKITCEFNIFSCFKSRRINSQIKSLFLNAGYILLWQI